MGRRIVGDRSQIFGAPSPTEQEGSGQGKGAGGEGLPVALHVADPGDGGKHAYVRNQSENKSSQDDADAVGETQSFTVTLVLTAEPHDRRNLTEKVIEDVRSTEGEGEGVAGMRDGIESRPNPGSGNELPAEVPAHGDPIEKGPVDGHAVVIGHGCEQEALSSFQGEKQVELGSTF